MTKLSLRPGGIDSASILFLRAARLRSGDSSRPSAIRRAAFMAPGFLTCTNTAMVVVYTNARLSGISENRVNVWEDKPMSIARGLAGAAVAALGLASSASAGLAAAGDECVKVLGYEWSGEKQSMDPADMDSGDDAYHIFAVYNRLLDVDDDGKLLPGTRDRMVGLAGRQDLDIQAARRREIPFRQGFHGSRCGLHLQALLDPALASGAPAVLTFMDADSVKALDPHTVTFTTKEPVSELPLLITNKFTNIVPEGATHEALHLHEDGTGPFVQEQFTPNAPVRLFKKNPNYWDAGKPKSDCLQVTVAQEAVAAVSAIKSGQVDLVLNVDPSVIGALKADPNVQLLQTGRFEFDDRFNVHRYAPFRRREGAASDEARRR